MAKIENSVKYGMICMMTALVPERTSTAPCETILTLIENHESQLLIGANLVLNELVLVFVMDMF